MEAFIALAMAAEAAGSELPFAIIDTATSRVIGSTRSMEIIPAHRALEIGWTWIGVPWQRTGCNTLCKFLLLRHAFEHLAMNRVQFKADARNTKSRAAIERIGGIYEGTLRKHRIARDGFVRDSAYYSVIAEEWPKVKNRLHEPMQWPESA
jgi:RimJ/RimL family protein N-acetyltransferase